MNTIVLLGGNGQLGQDLQRVLKKDYRVLPYDLPGCDITDANRVMEIVKNDGPSVVINCAAWTDVPGCEVNDAKAFSINALGAKHVAAACARTGAKLVFVGSDYVFDGRKNSPYIETDLPGPVNVYGLTKLMGEYYVQAACERFFIVRTSGLYGIHECQGKKTNFVETMLRLAREQEVLRVVDDEVLTPTFALNLAQQIKVLMATDDYGIYHATNNGSCSWFTFARRIFEIAKINVKIEKISARDFQSSVRRPAFSVLKNRALQNRGIDFMKMWDDALKDYFLDREHKLDI